MKRFLLLLVYIFSFVLAGVPTQNHEVADDGYTFFKTIGGISLLGYAFYTYVAATTPVSVSQDLGGVGSYTEKVTPEVSPVGWVYIGSMVMASIDVLFNNDNDESYGYYKDKLL